VKIKVKKILPKCNVMKGDWVRNELHNSLFENNKAKDLFPLLLSAGNNSKH